ncbi:MAG: hypothetical protein JWO03_868 [Bacteroidetes bacterium]|nr:hypothetical protein [Bacteroidota bacterium]
MATLPKFIALNHNQHIMKKSILAIVLLAAITVSKAQSLSPTVIASAGSYSVVGGTSLSSTVGEPVIQTLSQTNTILTQGFQQPNDIVNGLLDIEKEANGSFSVYPNPTQATLWFGYEFAETGKVEVSLYDIVGQKLGYSLNENYDSGKLVHSFDCSSYAAGNYVLSVKLTQSSGKEIILSKKFQVIN